LKQHAQHTLLLVHVFIAYKYVSGCALLQSI
jgi:hypothetical protein